MSRSAAGFLARLMLGAFLSTTAGCATDGALVEEARQGRDMESLVKLLDSETPWIAQDAARSIGEAGYLPAADALVRLLNSELADPHARGAAAVALGRLHLTAATPAIALRLERAGHPEERYALVHALSLLCTSEAVAVLEDQMSDNDVLVSRAARKGLLDCAGARPVATGSAP